MFNAGEILYFDQFQFKDGADPLAKYFIILHRLANGAIIGALPTRTNSVPSFVNIPHGCINHDERCYNCYVFEKGRAICNNGFSFDLTTFVYGDRVEDYKEESLDEKIEGVDYVKIGVLLDTELQALINCVKNSGSTKRKILRLFNQ